MGQEQEQQKSYKEEMEEKRLADIREYDFVYQLQESDMAIYRKDNSRYGKNFFEMQDGCFFFHIFQ